MIGKANTLHLITKSLQSSYSAGLLGDTFQKRPTRTLTRNRVAINGFTVFRLSITLTPSLPFEKGQGGISIEPRAAPNSLVPRQRLLKLPGPRRHFDLPGEDLPRCDCTGEDSAFLAFFVPMTVPSREMPAEKSLTAAIGIDCGKRCYTRLGSAPHGTGSHTDSASKLHVSSLREGLHGLMSIEYENELGFRCSESQSRIPLHQSRLQRALPSLCPFAPLPHRSRRAR